jgi:[acyl-carrier-protein] S-malonyltransferase
MTTTAYLFPGQGSQRTGMGRDLAERYPEVCGEVFAAADDVLGLPLSRLCWDGPAAELQRTEITQPAVFVASIAALRLLERSLPEPGMVAGHSLGEYTALVAAGVLDWTDALRLVRRRGELMAAVNDRTPGAMVAIIGLSTLDVIRCCGEAMVTTGEVVEVANYNDDTQHVISGTLAGVAAAAVRARGRSAKVVPLNVGAPFHCSLMRAAQEHLDAELSRVRFHDPRVPVVANVSATVIQTGEAARGALRQQLVGAVHWRQSLQRLVDHGIDTFVEVGPGRVLTGICRRMYPDLTAHSAAEARRVERTIHELTALPTG